MSDTQGHIRRDAMETAADWCDRLDELSTGERAELTAWLCASDENRKAFSVMRRTMLDVALLDASAALGAEAALQPAPRGPIGALAAWCGRHLRGPRPWLIGAGAVAAACVVLSVMSVHRPGPQEPAQTREFATAVRERANFKLDDNSIVFLNADSSVTARYSPNGRDLDLHKGEAVFEVAKDPARPFRVRTRSATVTAIGTIFGVDLVDRAVEVRVFKGTVRVAAGLERRAVSRGEWVILDPSRGISSGTFSPDTYQNWQTDWLEADNMPLSYVVAKLNRYTDDKITIKDKRLMSVALNGRFRLSNTRDTLSMISALLDVNVVRQKNEIVLVPRHE